MNISISEFTRGAAPKGPASRVLHINILHKLWPTSQYTNRQEGNKKDRERKGGKIAYIIEGEIIQLNMRYGNVSFEFLTGVADVTPCRLAEVDDLWSEEHKCRQNASFEKQTNICRKVKNNIPNNVRSSTFPASI
jgi:hypothetical protein